MKISLCRNEGRGGKGTALLLTAGMALSMPPRAAEEPVPPAPEDSLLPRSNLHVPISIKALMISLVDPAAHRIWDLSTYEELKESQWMTVGHFATQLAAAAPVLTLGGTGENDYEWVEAEEWTLYSRQMMEAAETAMEAVQEQDMELLGTASDRLLNACERCHKAFKPTLPHEQQHHPFYEFSYDPYTGRPA